MRLSYSIAVFASSLQVACGGNDISEAPVVAVFSVNPRSPDASYYERVGALASLGVRPILLRCGKFQVDRVRNPNEPSFIHVGGVTPYLLYFTIAAGDRTKISALEWFQLPLTPLWEQLLITPGPCGDLPESIRL